MRVSSVGLFLWSLPNSSNASSKMLGKFNVNYQVIFEALLMHLTMPFAILAYTVNHLNMA